LKHTAKILFSLLWVLLLTNISAETKHNTSINFNTSWSKQKANAWYSKQPWLVGCNFQPSTAINQIEMWAAETYDEKTIDTELGWANELGFNTVRVYLSSEVWKTDATGLKKRVDHFLTICNKHKIKAILVFFDDCWNEETTKGKQPAPKAGIHNSGWVQDPACSLRSDTLKLFPVLEKYVKDMIGTFKNDNRILFWDLYNEPGNSQHGINSLPLLRNVFNWAREVNPDQPVTSGIWYFGCNELNIFQSENSDIITYHNYEPEENHRNEISYLKMFGRPLICTEYMARRNNSLFRNIMPLLKQNNVGAINWGFVSGKTNTIFAWDEPMPDGKEPTLWFHDILRKDKSPFNTAEIEFIKKITGKKEQVQLMDPKDFDTKIDGKQVLLFTLRNRQGMVVQITNFGGKVVSLWTPDRDNNFADIVTGFKSIAEYQKTKEVYFGALIGRYGNRIAKGKFKLNGKEYVLPLNDNGNHLHGGPKGYHNVIWDARFFKNSYNEDALELKYLSKDGDEGYPGNLMITVIYTLTNNNELKIDYTATTDKPTVVNLTHHSFFNLFGFSGGIAKSINSHILKINADAYTPTTDGLIPTGLIAKVKNTPMDFENPIAIGERLNTNFSDLIYGKGYDHNWILNKHGNMLKEAAVIYEPSNGRQMRVLTDQPALQFYGGNFFQGNVTGKYNEIYAHRTSFALETQHYPDSPNHAEFPSTRLNPGEIYRHTCIYKFEIKN
jgi:galactose mutarotase-like enzyme